MFGIGKKKTVETMLDDLTKIGIALRHGVAVAQLFRDWSREDIEKSGYELLLAAMGDEQYDPSDFHVLEPLSDDVWHFDTEAIEDSGSYVRILNNCCRLTTGDLKFDSPTDHVDIENKIAWIDLTTPTGVERVEFKVDNDWVDPKVFDLFQDRLGATGSQRKLAAHDLGQDVLLVCKPVEQIERINHETGLRFGELRM
jgi:hypothetical protein